MPPARTPVGGVSDVMVGRFTSVTFADVADHSPCELRTANVTGADWYRLGVMQSRAVELTNWAGTICRHPTMHAV